MELLGDANWWLPRWLDRIIPRISIEGDGHPAAATSEDRAANLT
jgi:RND superfamily putative drug exporter